MRGHALTIATISRPDFRDLALEHSASDLVGVVASAVTYRELSTLAIETIVERTAKSPHCSGSSKPSNKNMRPIGRA